MRMEPVKPQDLTLRDLEVLETSTRLTYEGLRPADVVKWAMEGKALIFKFEGDEGEIGIMVTEFIQRKNGKELFFSHFAGEGMAPNTEFIYNELEKFCQEFGIRWMTGLGTEFLAGWLEEHCGFEKKNIFVVKEIPDG